MREALEAMAARLAVPRLDGEELARLEALTSTMEALPSVTRSTRSSRRTVRSTRARRRVRKRAAAGALRPALGQMGRYRRRSLALRGNLHRSVAEHRAILAALAERAIPTVRAGSWPTTSAFPSGVWRR